LIGVFESREGIMGSLLQNLRYAFRLAQKNVNFTVIVTLTLTLGIGATTSIFSIVYGVLLCPLPYPQPDQIVELWEINSGGTQLFFSDPNFQDVRSTSKTLEALAEADAGPTTVIAGGVPAKAVIATVSRDFFKVARVSPLLGRNLAADDHREGALPSLLVGYGYWQRNLGSTPDLAKFKLQISGQVFSIVGVMPPGFRFPDDAEIWTPREIYPQDTTRTAHNWIVYGRLRDGVSLTQARAEFATIARRLRQQYGQDTDMTKIAAERLQDTMTRHVRPALLVLLGAVGFLLLVACANVANLFLVQSAARRRELAIRVALGASHSRLMRQFVFESLSFCIAGCLLGVLGAYWGVRLLLALAPKDLPRLDSVSVNLPVLVFALCLSVLVATGLGISTALRAEARDIRDALGEDSRNHAGGTRTRNSGEIITAGQLAIALVLLVGASLLGRSLWRVLTVAPGFRTENVIAMDVSFSYFIVGDLGKIRRAETIDEVFTRLRAVPGIMDVGGGTKLPLMGELVQNGTFLELSAKQVPKLAQDLERLRHDPATAVHADYCVASEGYFSVLSIPLLQGRLFDERDVLDAPHAAVINEALARSRWPNENPIGKTIEFGSLDADTTLLTIVGVVGDVRNRTLEIPPSPTVYVNYRQRPQTTGSFSVVVRTSLPPAAVYSEAREVVRNIDPTLAPQFRTLAEIFSSSVAARRFNLVLISGFAGIALFLALAGTYGVTAYTTTLRTREIGIRMALGATETGVLRMILGEGIRVAMFGSVLGVACALALSQTMRSLLFNLSPVDPTSFVGASLLLGAASLLACWVPARRATRVDPARTLRYE
jgi:putative ABC transport system permease protein